LGASGDTTWLNLMTIGCWAKAAPASAKLVAAKAAAAIAARSLLRMFPPILSTGREPCGHRPLGFCATPSNRI